MDVVKVRGRFPRMAEFDFESDFDPDLDDFPRGNAPQFLNALPEAEFRRALGAAWLGYNEGVVLGERDFVIPASEIFAANKATKARGAEFDQVAVEEEFHILASMRACVAVRAQRDLQDLRFPMWQVAEELHDIQDAANRRGFGETTMLAMCYTFEATISSSFSYLSKDRVIQPSHSDWVSRHAEDESEHTRLFLTAMPEFFGSLTYYDQNRFLAAINATLNAMCMPTAGVWPTIADYFGLAYDNELIPDIVSPVTSLERSPVISRNLHRALTRTPSAHGA